MKACLYLYLYLFVYLYLYLSYWQVAMERKNALASARQSGGYPSSRSKGKDIKVLKSEFLNRETEPSTGSTGSVIQQLETSIEKMETSGVGTGQFSLPYFSLSKFYQIFQEMYFTNSYSATTAS